MSNNNPQQNENNNANHQFSNSEPMTFAQKVAFLEIPSNDKQGIIGKEFVPYSEALGLKQLGFDEPCFKYIYIGDTGNNLDLKLEVEPSEAENFNSEDLCVSRPTFSQAFRFFREKYKLHCHIEYIPAGDVYEWWIKYDRANYPTYEEAELACLRKLIEIVKGGNNDK